ncbi:ATP-binding protein [Rhodopirellula sp.]|nr:ATP-binding protein [Rhodopirellula sp.]
MFEACGRYQWARELLKNSIESGATKVEFGIEWQAVALESKYRRTVIDNGNGMDEKEIVDFFSTLGNGSKTIAGVHDNFGVGAKISVLPWNPVGVVVISRKNNVDSMIWISLDEDTNEYKLEEWETDDGLRCVINPAEILWPDDEINWGKVLPDWVEANGTAVILLGSRSHEDTILGNPDEQDSDIKGLSTYLNSRFWNLQKTTVTVRELRTRKKNLWPSNPNVSDDDGRPNNRSIKGARHYLLDITTTEGCLSDQGVLDLDDSRVKAHWYLWEGARPQIHMYAKKHGYIAIKYKDELYELSQKKPCFRQFGIIEPKIQKALTIILEPQLYMEHGRWGVLPDPSRNRLVFTGGADKAAALPIADWGAEFADKMPEPILAAITAARGDNEGQLEDKEYRRRLQNKFGNRWSKRVPVPSKTPDQDTDLPGAIGEESIEANPRGISRRTRTHSRPRKVKKTVTQKPNEPNLSGLPGQGTEPLTEKSTPVDVPIIMFENADAFEQPWHLATFAPASPSGAAVLINKESPILTEAIQHHVESYPPHLAEEVAKTVTQVFGEVAACKVAHSQKLTMDISEEELNTDYRSEKALTVGLMGLIAEESLISQRLSRLGKKRR